MGYEGEEELNADYGGKLHPSQQHVAPCVEGKGVEWGLGAPVLRMVATFWSGILVEVTVDARRGYCRRAAFGTPF